MMEEKNKTVTIKEITINEFEEEFLNDYETLFPEDEQRTWDHIQKTYSLNIEKFYKILGDSKIIGFIMLEKLENKPYYLDYFAIRKEFQSQGFGSKTIKALLNEIIKDDGICFEIEKENASDPNTIRRASFYKSLNFIEVNSTYSIFNVLYTPYYWNKSNKLYTKEEIDQIMFEYYEINTVAEAMKRYKICE